MSSIIMDVVIEVCKTEFKELQMAGIGGGAPSWTQTKCVISYIYENGRYGGVGSSQLLQISPDNQRIVTMILGINMIIVLMTLREQIT